MRKRGGPKRDPQRHVERRETLWDAGRCTRCGDPMTTGDLHALCADCRSDMRVHAAGWRQLVKDFGIAQRGRR